VSDLSKESRQTTHQTSGHAIYEELHAADDFKALRQKYRAFAIPWTIAFLAWYLLYVVMSMWATSFMDAKIVGNINVALVFGLLQFVTTFGLAWYYSRFSRSRLDPLARQLEEDYRAGAGADGRRGQA
jgi:uncharacterized membrane protein (DUF485 family)